MTPVRQIVIDAIIEKLKLIKYANGYSREILDENVRVTRVAPSGINPPAVFLIQGDEEVDPISMNQMYECNLQIGIGFMDVGQDDSDSEALEFMADIQKAMGCEFTITCTSAATGSSSTQIVNMFETGNSINISDSLVGYVLGQVGYMVSYRRHWLYPDKIA